MSTEQHKPLPLVAVVAYLAFLAGGVVSLFRWDWRPVVLGLAVALALAILAACFQRRRPVGVITISEPGWYEVTPGGARKLPDPRIEPDKPRD